MKNLAAPLAKFFAPKERHDSGARMPAASLRDMIEGLRVVLRRRGA